MDGQDRIELINTDLEGPFGITIDYSEQKIYWIDGIRDKIEYCNPDGTGRVTLISSLGGLGFGVPYSLTLEGDYLYWSEWDENALFSLHKTDRGNVSFILSDLPVNPNGIQSVSASRRVYSEFTNRVWQSMITTHYIYLFSTFNKSLNLCDKYGSEGGNVLHSLYLATYTLLTYACPMKKYKKSLFKFHTLNSNLYTASLSIIVCPC